MPVSSTATPEPKPMNRLCMKETRLPAPSATAMYSVSPGTGGASTWAAACCNDRPSLISSMRCRDDSSSQLTVMLSRSAR